MATGTLSTSAAIGSHVYSQSLSDTGGGQERHDIVLPAGLSGAAAWSGTTSVITLAVGHGLTTANKVALSGVFGKRVNITISAYDATSISVTNSTGAGDALPTTSTATIVVGKEILIADISFVTANVKFLLITADQDSTIDFKASTVSKLSKMVAGTTGIGYYWSYSSAVVNPFTSATIDNAIAYNHTLTAGTLIASVVLAT